MEQKNKLLFTIAVIFLIIAALFTSFGRSLFSLNTPKIVLPDVSQSDSSDFVQSDPSHTGLYQSVSVTTETVQNVVATLHRLDSYYRQVTVERHWEDGSSLSTIQVWSDEGWTHCRQVLPSGAIRHDLTSPDMLYYWYEGSQSYESITADERSADLAQHLPTYETILSLDPRDITAAGYELMEGFPCVYVETHPEGSQSITRYWVSVDSGLLICAQAQQNDTVIYRMTAFEPIQAPCPADVSFQLPDGTVLHTA